MSCYAYHSMKCRYCCTANGSVIKMEKEKAEEITNKYACHRGRGLVMPKENVFFCPDDSCQFCGPLDSVLDHVKDVHSMTIHNFSYGDVMRTPLHLVGKYLVLSAEDGATFFLWGVDTESGKKILSVVCADQATSCGSKFTFDMAHDLPPGVLCWLKGGRLNFPDKSARPCNTVGSSIINCGKNADVASVASAKSRTLHSHISNSNLGDAFMDNKHSGIVVPRSCDRNGKWYGDLILSISTLSDASKPEASVWQHVHYVRKA